jgi:hypothetical protein
VAGAAVRGTLAAAAGGAADAASEPQAIATAAATEASAAPERALTRSLNAIAILFLTPEPDYR